MPMSTMSTRADIGADGSRNEKLDTQFNAPSGGVYMPPITDTAKQFIAGIPDTYRDPAYIGNNQPVPPSMPTATKPQAPAATQPAGPDGSKEHPWTTNAQVKAAKPGDYVMHKGQVIPLKQADIDWANGIRPSAQPKTPQQAAETAVKTEAAQDPNMSIAKAQQIEKEAKDQAVMDEVVNSSRDAKSKYETAQKKYDTLLAQLQTAEDELMQAANEYNSYYEGGENSYDTKRAEASGVNVGNIAQAVNGKY